MSVAQDPRQLVLPLVDVDGFQYPVEVSDSNKPELDLMKRHLESVKFLHSQMEFDFDDILSV